MPNETFQFSDPHQTSEQKTPLYMVGESSNSELQQHLDTSDVFHDNINPSEHRLSPNIFLNLNFDNGVVADQSNGAGLTFEWSTSTLPNGNNFVSQHQVRTEQYSSKIPTPPPSAVLHSSESHYSATYDDMRYMNVDHFSILNLDQSILGSSYPTSELSPVEDNDKINHCLDIHQFSLNNDDSRNQEILEFERPVNININLANLSEEKY